MNNSILLIFRVCVQPKAMEDNAPEDARPYENHICILLIDNLSWDGTLRQLLVLLVEGQELQLSRHFLRFLMSFLGIIEEPSA